MAVNHAPAHTPQTAAHAPSTPNRAGVALAIIIAVIVTATALLLPGQSGDAGTMTHYMALLAANQPWNLIVFMAIPVVLAETLAVSELVLLFRQGAVRDWVKLLNRWAGLLVGPWFLGITVYLTKNAVVPLTTGAGWHGAADLIAVGAYLAGVVPLVGITLVELGIVGGPSARGQLRLHAIFVGIFLVTAHIAMIFGMLDPTLLGWNPSHTMADGSSMAGMTM